MRVTWAPRLRITPITLPIPRPIPTHSSASITRPTPWPWRLRIWRSTAAMLPWPTTVTGGPTVPIEGYDGNPVPAVFAQGYQGTDGTHYLLITNKSGSSIPMAIEVDGNVLQSNVTVSFISNASDTAQNTATNQTNVQIVSTTSPNPITLGPYSVTRVQW